MMYRLIVVSVIGINVLWGTVVHAASSMNLQYDTFAWQEYPDLKLHTSSRGTAWVYPDYDPEAFVKADYAEYEALYSKVGLVTCEGRRGGCLAIIHYSMDGYSRLVLRDLPLAEDQSVTMTFQLPTGTTEGVTRLMLWQSPPDVSWLDIMARHPNWLKEQVPGLLAQAWFRQGSRKAYFPPWEDEFRPDFDRPGIATQIGWPSCRAVPTAAGAVLAKDCSIGFNGRTELAFDEYGAFGKWVLDWSSELNLVFQNQPGTSGTAVDLVIYIERDPLLMLLSQPSIELTVNGWPLSELNILQTDDEDVQPYAVTVSHYMTDGINTINLKPSPFTGVDILIHGIELWVY